MVLTKEYIHKHKTPAGGWTREQLKALGVKWPATKGWISKLEGKEIDEFTREKFENPVYAKTTAKQKKEG